MRLQNAHLAWCSPLLGRVVVAVLAEAEAIAVVVRHARIALSGAGETGLAAGAGDGGSPRRDSACRRAGRPGSPPRRRAADAGESPGGSETPKRQR